MPRNIFFFITARCNCRCRHCFYWKEIDNKKTVSEELTLMEIRKIASSLYNIEGLTLTGGEPFLRDDLTEICELFYRYTGIRGIAIPTNGLRPNTINVVKEIIQRSRMTSNNFVLRVIVSLDGFKDTYKDIRAVDGFDTVIGTIKRLKLLSNKHRNLEVDVLTTISKKNVGEIKRLNEYLTKEIGVYQNFNLLRLSSQVFSITQKITRDFDPRDESFQLPSINELKGLYNFLKHRLSKRHELIMRLSIEMLKHKKKIIDCTSGRTMGVIYQNGDVALCEFTNSIGNLRETNFDFHSLWNSAKADEMREKTKSCGCIHQCSLGESLFLIRRPGLKEFLSSL